MHASTTSLSPRALVADDDDGVRRDYTRMLKHLGFSVESAADGREAAAKVKAGSFDLILSDIEMPHMTGLEFIRALRKVDMDVPVVLITGRPELDTAIEAMESGTFRYLKKPVDLAQLSRVVRHAVSLHQLARLKQEAFELVGSQGKPFECRRSLEARFDSALSNLWIAYQPIVNWAEQRVIAYEALVRSDEPAVKGPLELLDLAERLGRIHDLSRRIRALVAGAAADAPPAALLFVNLHSLDLNDPELYSPAAPLSAIASRVVLEITERASLDGVTGLASKVSQLRQLGYRVAIDDLGAGYAGLTSFTQIEPDFVKLDMSLVRGVDTSPRKQSVIRAITRLCTQELKTQVVTEGVETVAEREALAREGCSLLQGYLLAKPQRGFVSPILTPNDSPLTLELRN